MENLESMRQSYVDGDTVGLWECIKSYDRLTRHLIEVRNQFV